MNGRILYKDDPCLDKVPVHDNCRCYVEAVIAIIRNVYLRTGEKHGDYVVIPADELQWLQPVR